MKPKVHTRADITSRQLAELHRDIGVARLALVKIVAARDHGLLASGVDTVIKSSRELLGLMISLEAPFEKHHVNSPLSNPDHPDAWIIWLDEKKGSAT